MQTKQIKTLKQTDIRENLSEVVSEVARGGELIEIERAGIPVAALVSIQELAWIRERYKALSELGGVMDQMGEAFADLSEDERLVGIEETIEVTREK